MSEDQDVEAVVRQWHEAISSGDGETLKSLWDQDYDGLVFIVEEDNETRQDWPSIESYYDAQTGGPDRISWSIDNLLARAHGNAAWVYLTFSAAGRVESLEHDFVWNGRTSFFLRRRDSEWKIIHYHESLSRDSSHASWGWFFDQ